MKKVCILGWYGTETLGDRAILDGIFLVLSGIAPFEIHIGSLYPEFTKRTLLEDEPIYQKSAPDFQFHIFDVRDKKQLNKVIKKCDLVLMGGGPIMDLEELRYILKGFQMAKKLKKKTMLCGCGIGPLKQKKYIDITKKILSYSDLCIFRDKNSCLQARKLYDGTYYDSHDPAVISILNYAKNNHPNRTENYICINFRRITEEYHVENNFDATLLHLIEEASKTYEKVLLVPMHTFSIGGDDRKILTQLNNQVHQENVSVIHKPMNLYELYALYTNATACIGMRYHSIVMQTLLNGNNLIIDYTDKKNGKIISFMEQIDQDCFYQDKYINVKDKKPQLERLTHLKTESRFCVHETILEDTKAFYIQKLKRLLYETK